MGDNQRWRIEERIAHEIGLACMLLLLALLQVALPPQPIDLVPNILLLLVVCRALLQSSANAARWAFYSGIGLDLCSGTTLGVHAMALIIAVLTSRIALIRMNRTSWITPLAGVPLGMIAYYGTMAILISLLVAPIDLVRYSVSAVLPELLATLIPALPLFLGMRWLIERQRGGIAIDIY